MLGLGLAPPLHLAVVLVESLSLQASSLISVNKDTSICLDDPIALLCEYSLEKLQALFRHEVLSFPTRSTHLPKLQGRPIVTYLVTGVFE